MYAYLPRFSVKRRFSDPTPVTIRHLLTHHSGLPTNVVKGQWSQAHFSTVVEQLRNEHLSYPPDFVFAYSNIGYSLLGAVIEEVSGQSYESYVTENILQPLGMSNSVFLREGVDDGRLVMPAGLDEADRLLPIRDTPAMGLYSNSADMAKLMTMLVNGGRYQQYQVIHPAVLEEMMERNNEHVLLDYDHHDGLGFVLNHCEFDQAGVVVEHGGQTMYYTSHFIAVPEYRVAAIVLSNSSRDKKIAHVLARDMVATVLDQHFPQTGKKPLQPVVAGEEEAKPQVGATTTRTKYLTKSGLLTLQVDEADMCACMHGKRYDLVPAPGDGWYWLATKGGSERIADLAVSPQEVDGQSVLAARKGVREDRLGEYVPETAIPTSWRERLGDYQVINPDPEFPLEDVCLMEEDNTLFFSYRMPLLSSKRIDIPLTVLDSDQAVTTGLGRGRGETLLVEHTDEGEYLLYSGYLVKKKSVDEDIEVD